MISTHPLLSSWEWTCFFKSLFLISGENCFSLYTVSLHGLASHALLSVCVPSIVWLMKLQLDTVTVLPLYSKLKTNSPGSLMDLPNTYYGLTFGLGHSSQPIKDSVLQSELYPRRSLMSRWIRDVWGKSLLDRIWGKLEFKAAWFRA